MVNMKIVKMEVGEWTIPTYENSKAVKANDLLVLYSAPAATSGANKKARTNAPA